MIPILYEKTETKFTSNGLGRLADCTRCIVTEERNGIFECEFDYPVSGSLFDVIQIGRIIGATHDDSQKLQPFDIYAKSEPINGLVTFRAHHISYRLGENAVKPFTATSCALALDGIKTNLIKSAPFTFWTDKAVQGAYNVDVPKNARSLLVGEEGSILDVFGTGEYEFDRFEVKLHLHRGQDTNASIRYGKNLVDFTNEYNAEETYTSVVPFWLGDVTSEPEEGSEAEPETQTVLVTLPGWTVNSGESVPSGREVLAPLDLSDAFEEPPTTAQLQSIAEGRLDSSKAWLPNQTMTVDFVQLWQTKEYENYAPLQRLNLCDTCGVFVPMYGISVRAKVVKTEYNTLLDRYDSMELGDKPASYAAVIEKQYDSKVAGVEAGLRAVAVDIGTVQQAAAADATQKADAAEQAAISAASTDATTKANNAKTQAISSSNGYTDNQIASAKTTIEADYNQAIADATDKIRGGTGGYVVTTVNANGQPIELLITDNLNLNRAVNVWRWNQGGLAHSSNGYNGPFSDVAITADGKINASMILTGILQDPNGNTKFNLTDGSLTITKGTINLGDGKFVVDDTGKITALSGEIAGFTLETAGTKHFLKSEWAKTDGAIRSVSLGGNDDGATVNAQRPITVLGKDPGEDYNQTLFQVSQEGWLTSETKYYTSNDSKTIYSGIRTGRTGTREYYVSIYSNFDDDEENHATTLTVRRGAISLTNGAVNLSFPSDQAKKTSIPNLCIVGSRVFETTWTGSSKHNKKDITKNIADATDPKRLYDAEVYQFKYKDDYIDSDDQRAGVDLVGFIIEQLEEVYPTAVDKDDPNDSKSWSWNSAYIIPPMLKLIQEQKKEIDEMRAELDELKAELNEVKDLIKAVKK